MTCGGYYTTFSYDGKGQRTVIQDARGNVTTFVYDELGRMSALVDQLGQRTSYGYDNAGRQQWRLDAKAQRTTYTYDDANRQTGIQYSDGGLVTFTYDALGNRTKMEDSTGVTTYTYDELSRPKTITYPANKTITYTYDAVGNRSTMVDPDGGITTYAYNSRNMLDTLLNPFAETTTWVYDALGRVTTMTHANGTLAQHDYDAGGRITALRNLKADASVISIFTYSYDSIGNRMGVAEANGDLVTWSYDSSYQLTREQRNGSNAYDVTYLYDSVGNRLTKLEGGVTTTYTCDAANELLTAEDNTGITTFSYDANGNTTGELRPNGDRITYTWDIENHQTKVELPASVINTITLDGDGKRRTIEDSGGLKKLIWDEENILAETNSGNSTIAQYILKPEAYGELISQRRSGATSFHHFDALGSANKLTDGSAASLIEYLYRAFGQQTILSGSSVNPFTWVGQLGYYRQPDSADYWVRAMITSPNVGRRSNRDPLADYLNDYLYVENNPANLNDPSGLLSSPQHCERIRILIRRIVACIEERFNFCPGPGGSLCRRLNNLVYQLGHDCNDHRFDDTYRKDCKPIPKHKPDCMYIRPILADCLACETSSLAAECCERGKHNSHWTHETYCKCGEYAITLAILEEQREMQLKQLECEFDCYRKWKPF